MTEVQQTWKRTGQGEQQDVGLERVQTRDSTHLILGIISSGKGLFLETAAEPEVFWAGVGHE